IADQKEDAHPTTRSMSATLKATVGIAQVTRKVAVHGPIVTSVQMGIEPRRSLRVCRSIRPTRARRPTDASVDPAESRNVAGCGPDDGAGHRGGSRARRSSEVRPWDRTEQGPPDGSAASWA